MARDPIIAAALDRLPVPHHAPGFGDELRSRLHEADRRAAAAAGTTDAGPSDRDPSSDAPLVPLELKPGRARQHRRPKRFVPAVLMAAAAVTLVVLAGGQLIDRSSTGRPVVVTDDGVATPAVTADVGNEPFVTGSSTPDDSTPGGGPAGDPPVDDAGLAGAQQVVVDFIDALGAGDVVAAASLIGPVSEQRAEAAGGLEPLLRQSSEGHGAWAAVADRAVTAIGFEPGLVVVVLEGTLPVEGSTEHRVAVFPVRRAESAGAWFVEPWAHDLGTDPPMRVTTPTVDVEDRATTGDGPLSVTVQTTATGTVLASFGAAAPERSAVAGPGTTTFAHPGDAGLVTVVYRDDTTLYATAFAVEGD